MTNFLRKWLTPALAAVVATMLFIAGAKASYLQEHNLNWGWNLPVSTLTEEHECLNDPYIWGHKTESYFNVTASGSGYFSYTGHFNGYTIGWPNDIVWGPFYAYGDSGWDWEPGYDDDSFYSSRLWYPSGTFTDGGYSLPVIVEPYFRTKYPNGADACVLTTYQILRLPH